MHDQLLNFSFQDAPVRGAIAQATTSYQQLVLQKGDQAPYPLFVKQTLGEMTAILILMASNLKLQGKMSLQLRGSGHLYSLFSEVQLQDEKPLEIRGLARRQEGAQPTSLDIRDWVGDNASLAITLIPEQGQSYQGLIPIDHPRLAQCIEDYYERSEQIPSKLWTQVSDTSCAALMIQVMPTSSETKQKNSDLEADHIPAMDMETAQSLANTLAPDELISTSLEDMLHKLFHEYPVLKHAERAIEYRCSCSPERMKTTLISLGAEEIKSIAAETPMITMNCQFCGSDQSFDAREILDLIRTQS